MLADDSKERVAFILSGSRSTNKRQNVFSNRDIHGTSYRVPILLPHNPLWGFIMVLENLKMKAESSFETSGTIYPATLRHNPDSSITPV
jgi:hypothetical protein